MGPGVYLTPDYEVAKKAGKRLGGTTTVIECRLDIGNENVK
jgi:hypothetical protein